jgi:hypothetical protein
MGIQNPNIGQNGFHAGGVVIGTENGIILLMVFHIHTGNHPIGRRFLCVGATAQEKRQNQKKTHPFHSHTSGLV